MTLYKRLLFTLLAIIAFSFAQAENGINSPYSRFGLGTLSDQALMPFPSVKIGPGKSSRSHTADEYILISEIEEAIRIYIEILDGLKLS